MLKRFLMLFAVLVASLPGLALAYTCTPTGGCTFNVQYTEPAMLTNGTALTDLANTTITYTIAVDGGAPGAAKTVTVPASKPTGGSNIDKAITEPTLGPPHTYTISATATATSAAYGTSAASAPASKALNNGVSAVTPTGLTIQ
jgi:hypothetical protein